MGAIGAQGGKATGRAKKRGGKKFYSELGKLGVKAREEKAAIVANAPKFTISILGLNNLALSKRCVESVINGGGDWQIIFTDNGSTDGTAEWLREKRGQLGDKFMVVTNPRNMGFSDPNNHALTLAHGEFFICLNNDCVVPNGWLDVFEREFAKHPKAALVGPQSGCSELDNNFHGRIGNFEYVEGACLCCRVAIVKKHGLFSTYLQGAYGEDSDLSLRMRQLGYTLHRVPLYLIHSRAATSSQVPMARTWQSLNHVVLKEKWSHYLRVRKFDYPILVKRAGAWGDVLLTTPIIRALKEQNPTAQVWVETQCPDVFRDNPYVDRLGMSVQQTPDAKVIDLNMAYENRAETHIVDAYAWKAGITKFDRRLDFFTRDEDLAWVSERMPVDDNVVVIHAGPLSWKNKEWGIHNFAKLRQELNNLGYRVALVGGVGFPLEGDYDLRGQTNVHQLAAAMKGAFAFIGVDSFPMHLATAVGCPTVGIFGVTSPEFIMADGAPHVGVQGKHEMAGVRHRTIGKTFVEDHGAAIAQVSVQSVLAAFQQLVS